MNINNVKNVLTWPSGTSYQNIVEKSYNVENNGFIGFIGKSNASSKVLFTCYITLNSISVVNISKANAYNYNYSEISSSLIPVRKNDVVSCRFSTSTTETTPEALLRLYYH